MGYHCTTFLDIFFFRLLPDVIVEFLNDSLALRDKLRVHKPQES